MSRATSCLARWTAAALALVLTVALASGGRAQTPEPAQTPPARTEELVWTAPERDVDPVCGKDVVTAEAKSTVHDGWVYYFCSRDCRETFETSPHRYLNGEDRIAPPPSPALLERHPDGGRSHA